MKTIKSIVVIMFVLTVVHTHAQTLSQKQQQRENNEIVLLTEKEKNDIQLWFLQEIETMNMNEDQLADYESNLLVYTSRMMRLDDKDMGYTKDEIKTKLDDILDHLNTKMKTLLSEDQYDIHEFNFKVLINYVKLRLDVDAPKALPSKNTTLNKPISTGNMPLNSL